MGYGHSGQLNKNFSRFDTRLIWIYVAAEVVLLVLEKIFEATVSGQPETNAKYLAIVCNTIVVAYFYLKYGRYCSAPNNTSNNTPNNTSDNSRNYNCKSNSVVSNINSSYVNPNLLAYGLFVTVIADFFLTFLGTAQYYLPGIAAFCIVQAFYMLYLRPGRERKNLILRLLT